MRRQIQRSCHGEGLDVVLFEYQLDVELGGRIVAALGSKSTKKNMADLPVYCHA